MNIQYIVILWKEHIHVQFIQWKIRLRNEPSIKISLYLLKNKNCKPYWQTLDSWFFVSVKYSRIILICYWDLSKSNRIWTTGTVSKNGVTSQFIPDEQRQAIRSENRAMGAKSAAPIKSYASKNGVNSFLTHVFAECDAVVAKSCPSYQMWIIVVNPICMA